MAYERIRLEETGPVARLTLSWPEKRNALSIQMMEEVTHGLKALATRPDVRAVILGAEGPAFSAGHYLAEMVDKDLTHQRHVFDTCIEMMATVQAISQPVIAEVPGIATAAGCQLVATCDLAIASEGARFATPGVKIGLFCTTPMVALSRAVGRKRAMEMLLTGTRIDAATGVSLIASSPKTSCGRRPSSSRKKSPTRARSSSRSASKRSTRKSISTRTKPMATPKKS